MAIAIASQSTNISAADVDTVVIDKPTGLAVGDGLVAVIYCYNRFGGTTAITTPTDWTAGAFIVNSAAADSHSVGAFYKVADADDVAASNFTFETGGTRVYGILFRLTGSRTDVLSTIGDEFSTDDSPYSYTISATPTQPDTLLIAAHAVASNENWYDSNSPVISGTNPTWTKQWNSNVDVFTAPYTGTSEITSAAFSVSGTISGDSVGIILAINAQINANATLTTTVTGNSAFAPAGSAGAHTSLTTTVTGNEAFDPIAKSRNTTQWENPTKPNTEWDNPSKN